MAVAGAAAALGSRARAPVPQPSAGLLERQGWVRARDRDVGDAVAWTPELPRFGGLVGPDTQSKVELAHVSDQQLAPATLTFQVSDDDVVECRHLVPL